jgi:type VI secretion system protein ImpA
VPVLDFSALLAPVPNGPPSGKDLEYTPEMMELVGLAAEPDESVLKDVAAVDARNWRDIRTKTTRLLGQSKDLRLAALLARSTLQIDGVLGYLECVSFTATLVETFWAGSHPMLEEQGTDAVARLNALAELWSRPALSALRSAPLVSVRGLGDFSLRDILVAKGQEKPRPGVQPPNAQVVQRALEGAPTTAALVQAVRDAAGSLQKLELLVRERVVDHPFDPSPLRDVLAAMRQVLPSAQAASPEQPTAPAATESAPERPHSEVAQAMSASNSVVYREREITTRDDVVVMLDRICAYYEQHEPSSPVPLLMQRARRLVNMNFLELMKDLADKGMPQVEAIAGKESK